MTRDDVEDLIAQGRALSPWHLQVEIRPGLSTRDLAADDYPEEYGKVRLIDPGPAFTDTLERLFPEGLAGRSALDCACNCGGFLYWARDAGAGECLGIDVREHWIEQARFLARHRQSPSDGMRFETLDLYDLPELGLEPFDLTIFNGIFYHLPDPLRALRVAADLTREVLILNTSTRTGLPDGLLSIFEESRTRGVSGVYGLSWFPTGPQVVARMLRWAGLPEMRCNWWHELPGKPGHARMEVVAARDPEALRAFDSAAAASGPGLQRLVETSVPPGARVLVPPEGLEAAGQPSGRRIVELGAGDEASIIRELEAGRADGARYLAVPAGHDWLVARPDVRDHLRGRYELAAREPSVGAIYSLFGLQ